MQLAYAAGVPKPPSHIETVRRANLEALIEEADGVVNLARLTGGNLASRKSYISSIRTGTREMGDDFAELLRVTMEKPTGWMDQDHSNERPKNPEVAQITSQLRPTIRPTTMQWELILITEELPKEFTLPVRDDAMSPRLVRGGLAHCSTEAKHGPRDLVLIADAEGGLYIREYAEITATHWQAVAAQPGYLPLDSKAHGLRVLAKVVGAWWG